MFGLLFLVVAYLWLLFIGTIKAIYVILSYATIWPFKLIWNLIARKN